MIDSSLIFEATRRGYTDLRSACPNEIVDYFSDCSDESISGHLRNIKGILFEEKVVDILNNAGLDANLFDEVNHPATDIFVRNGFADFGEFQLKATDSCSYIKETMEANPDIPIITTTEVAKHFDIPTVIDSGISNADLDDSVQSCIFLDKRDASFEFVDAFSDVNDTILEAEGTETLRAGLNDISSDLGSDATDLVSDVASDAVLDTATEVGAEIASEVATDGLVEAVAENISPIPISPVGIAISAIGALFGLIF